MRFTYSSFTRRHRWLEDSASRCSWVTEEFGVEAGLHRPLLDQSVRLHLDSRLDYSCNHLGVACHIACLQSRRSRREHFRSVVQSSCSRRRPKPLCCAWNQPSARVNVTRHLRRLYSSPEACFQTMGCITSCERATDSERQSDYGGVVILCKTTSLARRFYLSILRFSYSSFARGHHWLEGSTHPLQNCIIGQRILFILCNTASLANRFYSSFTRRHPWREGSTIIFLLCLSLSARRRPSISARRPPSACGSPSCFRDSLSSWADYPSLNLTSLHHRLEG